MRVKKIILKNFIKPGIQDFIFDDNQKLVGGKFYDFKILPVLNELFNGKWENYSKSFQEYYPNFRKKVEDMNLEMDALIGFDDDELEEFNKISLKICGRSQKSNYWYYSIKCRYPYIFPIAKLVPAEFKEDDSFSLGSHHESFFKSVVSKNDLLTMNMMKAISNFRDLYYAYKFVPISFEELAEHKQYTEFLRAIFIYSEDFIRKISTLIGQIDDGDIIRYGEDTDFYFRLKQLKDFFKQYSFLTDNQFIFEDFKKVFGKFVLSELDWIYSTKTPVNLIEMRTLIWQEFGTRNIPIKVINKIVDFKLNFDKSIVKNIRQRDFEDSQRDPILFSKKDNIINYFAKGYEYTTPIQVDLKEDENEFNIMKGTIVNEKNFKKNLKRK